MLVKLLLDCLNISNKRRLRGATLIRREVSMCIPKDAVILTGRRILEEIVYTIITV